MTFGHFTLVSFSIENRLCDVRLIKTYFNETNTILKIFTHFIERTTFLIQLKICRSNFTRFSCLLVAKSTPALVFYFNTK